MRVVDGWIDGCLSVSAGNWVREGGFGVDLFVADVSFSGVAESGLRWWR